LFSFFVLISIIFCFLVFYFPFLFFTGPSNLLHFCSKYMYLFSFTYLSLSLMLYFL
jgi:hypothetical protein